MHRCIDLASTARKHTGTNPLVGAVLVRDASIVAEGVHKAFGRDHAETDLFKNFDQEVHPSDTLYINLEPCAHHGKTPPCVDLLLKKNIQHVVYGMYDPDPRTAGKGIQRLQEHGVRCTGPILRAQCEFLNRGFMTLQKKGRPWITLKRAQTSDGRIAKQDRSPLAITSHQQDIWSHQNLRTMHDAILVGVETIITDNPHLTIRHTSDQHLTHPWRIVLDPHFRIPRDAYVVQEGTMVITSSQYSQHEDVSLLEGHGVRVQCLPMDDAVFQWDALWDAICTPHMSYHGSTSVLVEGGKRTWQAFAGAGMMDMEVVLIGKLRGGKTAR